MAAWIVALLLVLVTVRAHRRARDLSPAAIRRWLIAFAALVFLQALALVGAQTLPAALATVGIALAGGLGFGLWAAIAHLVAYGTRRRDLMLRVPLLVVALLAFAAGVVGTASVFATLATLSYRWKAPFETRRLFQLAWAALALAVTALRLAPDIDRGTLSGPPHALATLALIARNVAGFHALIGAFRLFAAFVRDPTLGIRRVSRRLALSHVLVGLVPLALTALLWAFTTLLGVSQERAAAGARALASEGDRLRRSLLSATEGPEPREALRRFAAAHSADWPALGVWWREGLTLERLGGDAVDQEGALGLWVDSLSSLPDSGIIALGDSVYLGAAVRGAGGGAVALTSLHRVLREGPSRIVQSPLLVTVEGDAPVTTAATPDPEESLAVERVRSVTRRFGVPDTAIQASPPRRRARISAGADTFAASRSGILQGMALVDGLFYRPTGWERSSFMLSSRTDPLEVFAGFFRRAQESPLGYVPIVLLGLMAILFLAIAIWDVVMVANMGRSITGAIRALRGAAQRLEAGDLSHRIQVAGRDELWSVAEAFNTATAGLEQARAREQERQRLESELQVARGIQSRLMPGGPPKVRGLEIAGRYEPAREVGGDYYDHVPAGGDRVLLAIADVSGKSVPASLIMSAFRAALHSQDLSATEPAVLAERLNQFLHESLDPGKFVTAFLGLVDGATGRLTYVNAGHNPPVLLRKDGADELLDKGGTILGILPGSRYEQCDVMLEMGDLLVLYTDGVTEAANPEGEPWGETRLVETMRRLARRPSSEIAAGIASEVRAFEADRGAADDVTLLVVRRV